MHTSIRHTYSIQLVVFLVMCVFVFALAVRVDASSVCCNHGSSCYDADQNGGVCQAGDESLNGYMCQAGNCVLEQTQSAPNATQTTIDNSAAANKKGAKNPSASSAKPAAPSNSASTKTSGPYIPPPGAPTNPGEPEGAPVAGGSPFLPKCATTEGKGVGYGCRDVSVFVALFVDYANATFGIIGAVAFLFFVYGGIVLLTSAGSPELVKKGKDVLVGAVIGLMLVFGASLIIRFVISGITGTNNTNLQVTLPDTTNAQ